MPISQVKQAAVGKLRAHPANAHAHSKKQLIQIARSIRQFGFTVPIIVDENNVILAGHGRWLAAQQLGLKLVPVVVLSGLSDAERRAYLLADNKLVENAGWNRAALALELKELAPLLSDAGLDISLTAFQPAEIDSLLGDLVDPELDPADDVPPPEKEAITRIGDLWELGPHRLLCGDALSATDLRRLMGTESAAMVITDPPFNLPIKQVQGRGRIKHGNFAQASGEMSPAAVHPLLAYRPRHSLQSTRPAARSISSSSTGDTSASCWPPGRLSTPNSRTWSSG